MSAEIYYYYYENYDSSFFETSPDMKKQSALYLYTINTIKNISKV